MHRAVPSALSMLRSAALGAAAAILVVTSLQVAAVPAAEFTNPAAFLSGTTPSGIAWSAVATGTALPIRSSGTQNGLPGAVAYFDTNTGRIQLDPKGWNLSLFNITYTTGTVNTSGTTPGPFQYATGTTPTSAIVSGTFGTANQKTLPAGTWTLITCNQARIAGTVSLVRSPTLATSYDSGNGAANGTSPYATDPSGAASVPGWFNQPWSFPYQGDAAGTAGLVNSGSIATMSVANFRTFGVSGNANANILGYGNYQSTFQYTIDGVTGNMVGAMIPYASTALPANLIWNTTSGTWNTAATNWTTGTGGALSFVNGDTTTFSGTGGGSVTLSGSLAPSAVTVSATAGTYTFNSSAGNQITGTTGLSKSGAGTLVLAGPNAYSGTTALTAGTLRAGDNAAFGTGTLALNGGTLSSDGATARSFSNAVVVGGDVTLGDGTATGALTFSGGVNLGGATRTLTTVAETTLSGVVSNGGLTKAGVGTLTLTGSNTYAGGTTVSAGHLVIGDGGTTGSVTGNIVNNSVLWFKRSDAVTYAGVISGTGSLYKSSAGTLTLTSNSTFTGDTHVNDGTLALSGAGSIAGSDSIYVENGATLDVSAVTGGWQLGSGQTLVGGGTIVGPATAAVGSTVRPAGESTSILTATGGFTLLGLLDIDVNGSFISMLDASAGGLTLGGSVNFNTLAAPTGNLVFATYQSLAGTFGSITGLPTGYSIDYAYLGNQIALVQSGPGGVPEIDPAGLGSIVALVAGALGMLERRRAGRRPARRG
jgi:autotransporter-associated beta strand protein